MKVNYEWEKQDIQVGRYIIRQSATKGSENISFAASVTYKIGFITGKPDYCLISITDGMILKVGTVGVMLEHLNLDRHGYRPLTQEELLIQISHLKEQNVGHF